MCYAKPGIRCSAFMNQRRSTLARELNKARSEMNDIEDMIANATGGTTRLEAKLAAAVAKTAALHIAEKKAIAAWEKTPAGIAHLREMAADTALKASEREGYRVKADRLEAEAAKALNAVRVSREREITLRNDLAEAGVPEETIKRVMDMKAESTFGSSVVSSSTAKKNLMQAQKSLEALRMEGEKAIAATNSPAERAGVFDSYTAKLAAARDRVQLNEAAYLTTPSGIKELEDEAAEVDGKLQPKKKARLTLKAKEARKTRETLLGANNLRRHRENAIREAMVAAGKDPEAAIKAYRKNRKIVPGKAGRRSKAPEFKVSTSATTTLTASEYATLDAEATAAGATVGGLIRLRALGMPTTHMNGNIREVMAQAPVKPKMTGHRNTTVLGARRELSEGIGFTPHEKSIIKVRAKTYGMTVSSYLRACALGLDVRQIQADRSDVVNDLKSAVMMNNHATPEQSARNLAA